jgi:hypothetical protein
MQSMQELGWSQVVELLKAASEDFRFAQTLVERCSSLTGQEISVDPTAKARVLLLGLARGHALLKLAVEWEQPFIGRQQQPNQLDCLWGSLWRHVMAFSGWELAARSVIWDRTKQKWFKQSSLACLCDHSTTPAPPWSNREQVSANLEQWLAPSMDKQHPLPDFLALGDGQADFFPWLLGETHQLHPWAVLACIRNVVAHGAPSPTKAQQWDLASVYDDGVAVLHTLFRRLLTATVDL